MTHCRPALGSVIFVKPDCLPGPKKGEDIVVYVYCALSADWVCDDIA
jgi:hypothetical protein